jgi:hypothetical protein
MNRRKAALGVFAAVLAAQLIAGPFRAGLRRMETDFPNDYTAAILTAKHMPLRQFYDWVWFQRQMHYAGIEHQLGGYIPYTPLTMMPFLPLARFAPLRAKQIWVTLQLLLLAAGVLLLARISRLSAVDVLVVVLLAHRAVAANLRLGQYYIFILALLIAGFWCLLRKRPYLGGALLGLIFALKLYTAPFALYFAARRQWKSLLGFAGAAGVLGLLAVTVFGWRDVWFFANTVMMRGIDGSVNDPYNPGLASMTAFLWRTFMAEPELNPHPLWHAPAAFFFLRAAYSLSVLGIALVALAKTRRYSEAHALAWFVIVLFVLSPNEASCHFVLLAVPVALLLHGASRRWAAGLIALYVAVELPLFSWDARLFPKAWLTLGLFFYAGWRFLRQLRPAAVSATVLAVMVVAAGLAFERTRVFRTETPQLSRPAIVEPNGIYSSSPARGAAGWMHEALAGDRYVLRRWTSAGTRTYSFDGDAFHPAQSNQSATVAFELAGNGRSRICLFDPDNGKFEVAITGGLNPTEPTLSPDGTKLVFVAGGSLYLAGNGSYRLLGSGGISNPAFFPDGERIVFAKGRGGARSIQSMAISSGAGHTIVNAGDCYEPAVSPDGRLLAFTSSATGGRHIWVQELASGVRSRLTYGFCNNDSPAWDRDSRSIVFASDCNRGLGLTALYRLTLRADQR